MTTPGRGLHGRVLETLGPAITAGEYPPGSVLRTDELAQRFDVSRSVMREAVRVLESTHLGAAPPHPPRPLTVLRSAIEPVAAGLAARFATAEQCARLTECALGMVATSR